MKGVEVHSEPVPHTCCVVREGVYYRCYKCHRGDIQALMAGLQCDEHFSRQIREDAEKFRLIAIGMNVSY